MRRPQQYIPLLVAFENALDKNAKESLESTVLKINQSLEISKNGNHDLDKINALDKLIKLYVDGLRDLSHNYGLAQNTAFLGFVYSYGELIDSGIERQHPEVTFSAEHITKDQALLEISPEIPFNMTVHLYQWALTNNYFPTTHDFQLFFLPNADAHLDPQLQKNNLVMHTSV
tara:strand:+ start:89 stop:607 length:519 start_codon:yes stop_codon:yes gene_type:complete